MISYSTFQVNEVQPYCLKAGQKALFTSDFWLLTTELLLYHSTYSTLQVGEVQRSCLKARHRANFTSDF